MCDFFKINSGASGYFSHKSCKNLCCRFSQNFVSCDIKNRTSYCKKENKNQSNFIFRKIFHQFPDCSFEIFCLFSGSHSAVWTSAHRASLSFTHDSSPPFRVFLQVLLLIAETLRSADILHKFSEVLHAFLFLLLFLHLIQ